MYKHITIYTLFLLLLIACGSSERGRMLAVLDEADSLNRNYIPFTTDSALKIAAEWFDSYGSANERVRAHYLLGCAYRDMGEAPAALQSYHDAVDCADTTSTDCDYRLLSRVHGQMGDIFIQEYLPTQALKEYNKASAYSLYEQDTIASLLFEEAKLQSYYMLNKEDSILSLTDKLRSQYIHLGCFKQAAGVVVEQLFIYARKKKLPELKEHLDFFSSQKDLNINTYQWSNYNYLYGMYYLGYNSLDSAEYFFRKQLMTANRDITKLVLAYFGLLELYKEKKIPDSLYKYSKLYSITNDSSNIHTESTIISRIQSQYDYTRHQQIAIEKTNANTRYRLILIVSSFLIVVLFLVILLYVTHTRKRQTEQKNIETELSMRIIQLEKEKSLRELSDIEEQLQCNPIVIRFHHYAENPPAMPTNADWVELRKLIQKVYPNFTKTLQSSGHLLRNEEIQICILIRLNFHMKHISNLMGMRMSTIANIRKRLLYKLFNKKEGSALDFDKQIRAI